MGRRAPEGDLVDLHDASRIVVEPETPGSPKESPAGRQHAQPSWLGLTTTMQRGPPGHVLMRMAPVSFSHCLLYRDLRVVAAQCGRRLRRCCRCHHHCPQEARVVWPLHLSWVQKLPVLFSYLLAHLRACFFVLVLADLT